MSQVTGKYIFAKVYAFKWEIVIRLLFYDNWFLSRRYYPNRSFLLRYLYILSVLLIRLMIHRGGIVQLLWGCILNYQTWYIAEGAVFQDL